MDLSHYVVDGDALRRAFLSGGVTPERAREAYARFFRRYPEIERLVERMQQAAVDGVEGLPCDGFLRGQPRLVDREDGPPPEYRSVETGRYPNMTEAFVAERRKRIALSVARGFTPRIEVGSVDMRCFFGGAVDYYQPTFGGVLMQIEDGTAQNSTDNVHEIAARLGPPLSVRARYGKQFEFWFPGSQWYVATGFGVGRYTDGLRRLAEVLVEFGLPGEDGSLAAELKMRRHLRWKLAVDHTGPVVRYVGRHDAQPTRKTWVVGAVMSPTGSVL